RGRCGPRRRGGRGPPRGPPAARTGGRRARPSRGRGRRGPRAGPPPCPGWRSPGRGPRRGAGSGRRSSGRRATRRGRCAGCRGAGARWGSGRSVRSARPASCQADASGRIRGHLGIADTVGSEEAGPMATEPAEIVYVVFPGLQVLDLTGPHDVLARANLIAGAPLYRSTVAARTAGPVTASSGLTIVAEEALADIDRDIDTLMVVGGHGTPEALGDRTLVDDVRRLAARARRVTAVCSGAFLLAEAGLLDGRRATTHWQVWEHLAAMYPAIDVGPDPIPVNA